MGKRKGGRDDVWHAREFILENPALLEYYVEQGVVATGEVDAFAVALRKPLGAALRLNPANPGLPELVRHLHEDFQFEGQRITLETGEAFEPPRPIQWVPDHCAWRLNVARKDLRKSPQLTKFFNWVKRHNALGNLTRQEEVSMIPPLLLDVHPHHRVLDLCAAPGSKTTQIAEILHAASRDAPSGVLVANDVDKKRALVLSHQQRRLGSPAVVVTQHPAQNFPALELQSREDMAREMGVSVHELPPSPLPEAETVESSEGFFDRVLCDVPCSGDGTLRKNPMIWRNWSPADAINLHPLQLSIAKRGARVLKVGGIMVYSTCSLNPIEDEAVVAALLREGRGALELVDCADRLSALRRSAGLSTWRVPDAPRTMLYGRAMPDKRKRRRGGAKEGEEEEEEAAPSMNTKEEVAAVPYESRFKWYSAEEEVAAARFKELNLRSTMFPPSAEEVAGLHLDRCVRLLPHSQDTGGFFVAVLRKTGPITPAVRWAEHRGREQEEEKQEEKEEKKEGGNAGKKRMEEEEEEKQEEKEEKKEGGSAGKKGMEEEEEEGKNEVKVAAASASGAATEAGSGSGAAAAPAEAGAQAGEGRGNGRAQRKQQRKKGRAPNDFLRPLPAPLRRHVIECYGMDSSFPWHLLFCRSESARMVTLVSETVARACILGAAASKLKVVFTGVKCFERAGKAGSDTPPRLLQEAAVMLGASATQRMLRLPFSAYFALLTRPRDPLSLEDLEGELAAQAAALSQGPVIVAPAAAASADLGAALSEEEAAQVPVFARIAREAPQSLLLSCFLGARTLNNAAGVGLSRKIRNALVGDDIERIHAEEEATRARNREMSEAGGREEPDGEGEGEENPETAPAAAPTPDAKS